MDQILNKQIPLDIGTLNLEITLKFVPNGIQENGIEHQSTSVNSGIPSPASKFPATENQKRALHNMARRLGRQIELERLSKSEASNLIDELGAELRRRQNPLD
ncbi:MAG: DUF3072 domain-containing protein [Chloroflexi bacterium]|nr:DUF3072 domain-containing protein [Chloroflexota bacterium]